MTPAQEMLFDQIWESGEVRFTSYGYRLWKAKIIFAPQNNNLTIDGPTAGSISDAFYKLVNFVTNELEIGNLKRDNDRHSHDWYMVSLRKMKSNAILAD